MKNISLDNITEAATGSFAGLPDARQRHLVQTLVATLHQYARDVKLTHHEWRAALDFLQRSAAISSESRSEFTLLSDVLGISSLVDLLATDPAATPGSVLGPFHTAGSPWMDNPANLIGSNEGERVILRGRVTDTAGRPLSGATLDFWQNAANGLYWQVDPTQPSDNLRCQLRVDADARYEIATTRVVPYQIPTDGPVWFDLVEPAGRTAWRPAHYHLIVAAPGYRTLVTEIFDAEDTWLERDAVFGVREPLVGRYQRVNDAALAKRLGVEGTECLVMEMDIRLSAG
jgi:protocatechuate 3,4-dioxygenase beta subunit